MTARRAKQIVYGALYLIVLIGIIDAASAVFMPRLPTAPVTASSACPGMGCGAAGIVVGGMTTFVSSPGRDTFLARIENHNPGFGSPDFGYRFDVVTAEGVRVQSFPGESFLYGGEVKYIVMPNVAIGTQSSTVTLSIENPIWEPASAMGFAPQFGNPLPVTASSMTSSTLTVSSALTDSDASAFSNVAIVAVFYGRDGIAVGASQTELDSIAPGETEQFSVSYPYFQDADPLLTKIFAYALRPL